MPRLDRTEKAEPYRDQIIELLQQCRGNLVRVHEELIATGVAISYPALTAFCRRHGIGHAPKPPVGHYDLAMGQDYGESRVMVSRRRRSRTSPAISA